jgi:hypothetical protein
MYVCVCVILTMNRDPFYKEQQEGDLYNGEVTVCMQWERNC